MFYYRKRLIYPVHVEGPDPILVKELREDYERELISCIQYLNHRAYIANRFVRELLGLIAAEELGHMEIISVAISKLGGPPLIFDNLRWGINNIDQTLDASSVLKINIEAEARASQRYLQHMELTSDPHMRRLNKFLSNREEVHKRLLQKAQMLIREIGSTEEFNELIYDYKISLQILE